MGCGIHIFPAGGVAFRVLALSTEGKDEDLNNGDIRWEYSLPKFNGWNLKMAPLGICWKLLVFKFHVKLEEFYLGVSWYSVGFLVK